jgi:predicted alpha/beta-fold hydrolase
MMRYVPPKLHRGGHLQSILSAKASRAPHPLWQRERWEWDDGDFCDADWLNQAKADAKLLVLFHGLEGSSQSHYARSIGAHFQAQGWRVVVPHFRGCSGEPNRLLRAYHSGDAAEIERMLNRVQHTFPQAPLYAAGVSLGGNALLTYLATRATSVPLQAAAAVCAPLDLARCEEAITTGFSNIYTLMFMQTLRSKTLEKRQRFPNACDWQGVIRSKNLYEFDDVFTAPVHGYQNVDDYYARASAKPLLQAICQPTLLLNALNDPFVPQDIVANLKVSPSVTVHQPAQGGHVGFAQGSGMGQLDWLPQRLHHWFTKGA